MMSFSVRTPTKSPLSPTMAAAERSLTMMRSTASASVESIVHMTVSRWQMRSETVCWPRLIISSGARCRKGVAAAASVAMLSCSSVRALVAVDGSAVISPGGWVADRIKSV